MSKPTVQATTIRKGCGKWIRRPEGFESTQWHHRATISPIQQTLTLSSTIHKWRPIQSTIHLHISSIPTLLYPNPSTWLGARYWVADLANSTNSPTSTKTSTGPWWRSSRISSASITGSTGRVRSSKTRMVWRTMVMLMLMRKGRIIIIIIWRLGRVRRMATRGRGKGVGVGVGCCRIIGVRCRDVRWRRCRLLSIVICIFWGMRSRFCIRGALMSSRGSNFASFLFYDFSCWIDCLCLNNYWLMPDSYTLYALLLNNWFFVRAKKIGGKGVWYFHAFRWFFILMQVGIFY